MPTPTKPTRTPEPAERMLGEELERKLVSEFQYLSEIVSGFVPDAAKGSIIVARALNGLDITTWRKLANKYNLDSWIGIPIGPSSTEALASLHARISELIFQRDHDVLTGLPNRRFFEERFSIEYDRAKRMQTPLSLAMLDLDNFKLVNDTYGHHCGDLVLEGLGSHILKSLRSYDFAARIGGEEFVIILPGVKPEQARKQAERLLASFREEIFECDKGNRFNMTFSCGIAALTDNCAASQEELLCQADNAMYDAKRQGKNRIAVTGNCDKSACPNVLVHSDEKKLLFSLLTGH